MIKPILFSAPMVQTHDFMFLWNSLNAKRGYGWETNPWVGVYTFELCEKPKGWPI